MRHNFDIFWACLLIQIWRAKQLILLLSCFIMFHALIWLWHSIPSFISLDRISLNRGLLKNITTRWRYSKNRMQWLNKQQYHEAHTDFYHFFRFFYFNVQFFSLNFCLYSLRRESCSKNNNYNKTAKNILISISYLFNSVVFFIFHFVAELSETTKLTKGCSQNSWIAH